LGKKRGADRMLLPRELVESVPGIVFLIRDVKNGFKLKSKMIGFKRYKHCFSGISSVYLPQSLSSIAIYPESSLTCSCFFLVTNRQWSSEVASGKPKATEWKQRSRGDAGSTYPRERRLQTRVRSRRSFLCWKQRLLSILGMYSYKLYRAFGSHSSLS